MKRTRRGGIVIIVAVGLSILAGFVALAVDVGYAWLMRTRLDMALEAASDAAIKELDNTEEGIDNARDMAIYMASVTTIGGEALSLNSADVEFGSWSDEDRSFSTIADPYADPTLVNAVRLQTSATIPLLLGVLAVNEDSDVADGFEVEVTQVAITGQPGGAYATDCPLPLAIPDCYVDADGDGVVDSGVNELLFDAGACAEDYSSSYKQAFLITEGAFLPAKAKTQVDDCYAATVYSFSVGDVLGSDVYLSVDSSTFNNDTSTNPIREIWTDIPGSATSLDDRWSDGTPSRLTRSEISSSNFGKTIERPVMVVDVDDSICSGTDVHAGNLSSLTAGGEVIGFVWGTIYDTQRRCRKDSTTTTGSSCPTGAVVNACTNSNIGSSSITYLDAAARLRFRVHIPDDDEDGYPEGTVSGGPNWGVTALGEVRLIP